MILVKNIDQYNENYVYFCDPIKNNIMNEGTFSRIIYSTPRLSINGIFINILLNDICIEKYYNKLKCTYNIFSNQQLFEDIKIIETALLKKINIPKIPQFKIYDQLRSGCIKIFNENSIISNYNFLLKISGVWESDMHYGLTFKFITLTNHL